VSRQQGSIYAQTLQSGKKVWKVEVEIGRKPDGTRIRRRRTAHSLQEARLEKRKLLDLAETGFQAAQTNQRLDVFAYWWIREVKAGTVKAATAADYEHRYRRHISPILGRKKIEAITSRDVYGLRASIRSSGHSTPTVNGALQVLKAILNAAVLEGAIVVSPARQVSKLRKSPSEPTQVREPLSAAEARRLFEACEDDAVGISVALGLALGLRKGEVLGLKWCDVDMARRTLSIVRTLREVTVYDEGGRGHTSLVEDVPKTRSSVRSLTVPDALWGRLKVRNIDFTFGKDDCSNKWVTGDQDGSPLHPAKLAKGYAQLLKRAEVRGIRFHDLRHTAATLGVAGGARLEAVSQSLGHSRVDTTKSIYARTVKELSTEFSSAMSAALTS
jgi:integrase